MNTPPKCDACGNGYDLDDHRVCLESSYLMLHVCPACLDGYVRQYSAPCVNCQGRILPHSQVAVFKNDDPARPELAHTTVACNPAGNTFYGYWGKGELKSVFACIEQC